MIDFVRVKFKDRDKIELFVTDVANFERCYTVLEKNSGEILYPYRVYLKGMEISINEKSAYMKNSIHKMMNAIDYQDAQNYNNFGYFKLNKSIDFLNKKVLNSGVERLTQLEFGLNIITDVPAKGIIVKNIIYHKFKKDNVSTNFNGKGQYKQFEHSNYYLKIYDKAKQYNLAYNLLRVEVKYFGSKVINKLGIFNLFDLKDKAVLKNLFNDLLKRFDELIIVDDLPTDISDNDKAEIQKYLSFNYWEVLSERKNRNKKSYHIKRFNSLLKSNDLLKTKKSLRESLVDKFNVLIEN